MSEVTSTQVNRYMEMVAVAAAAAVEKALETAIQGGTCGVRVWRYENGLTTMVDRSVPYGYVYEMPFGRRPPTGTDEMRREDIDAHNS